LIDPPQQQAGVSISESERQRVIFREILAALKEDTDPGGPGGVFQSYSFPCYLFPACGTLKYV
jgi:hypothetical protein